MIQNLQVYLHTNILYEIAVIGYHIFQYLCSSMNMK